MKWLFRRKKQIATAPNTEPYTGKYYVILIDGIDYKSAEVWINVDKIFGRIPNKGECFRYDVNMDGKPAHCTVMAICDSEKKAREISDNLYV